MYSFHQVDVVEHFANQKRWDCHRVDQDELVLVVKGQVRLHVIKVEWIPKTETLNMQCIMNMVPREHQISEFYNLVNQCNRILSYGKFVFLEVEFCLTYQTHFLLVGKKLSTLQEILIIVSSMVTAVDTFLPAFTTLATSHDEAMEILERFQPLRLPNKK